MSHNDAMCVIQNLIKDNQVVYGGGLAEIACSIAISKYVDAVLGVDQYVTRAFVGTLTNQLSKDNIQLHLL
eukprot:4578774-Ditylum_brightwellii.AAC.1